MSAFMDSWHRPVLGFIIIPCLLFSLTACSIFSPPSMGPVSHVSPGEAPSSATELISHIRSRNDSLPTTFKGIGTVQFVLDGVRQTARMAWMGALPSKFMFVIQNVFGQPVMNISGDGRYLYYASFLQQPEFHKIESPNPSLKPFISIPIRIGEALDLLSGRIPLPECDHASVDVIHDETGSHQVRVLVLKKRWLGWLRKIYFNHNDEVYKIERFDAKERLVYRAEFSEYTFVDGYALPHRLVLSASDGRTFRLTSDRYWLNFPVAPEMFVLTPDKR